MNQIYAIYGKNQYKILSTVEKGPSERILLEMFSNPTNSSTSFGVLVTTSKKDGQALGREAVKKSLKLASFNDIDSARRGIRSLLNFT